MVVFVELPEMFPVLVYFLLLLSPQLKLTRVAVTEQAQPDVSAPSHLNRDEHPNQ